MWVDSVQRKNFELVQETFKWLHKRTTNSNNYESIMNFISIATTENNTIPPPIQPDTSVANEGEDQRRSRSAKAATICATTTDVVATAHVDTDDV
jgi:cell division septation protein DedD